MNRNLQSSRERLKQEHERLERQRRDQERRENERRERERRVWRPRRRRGDHGPGLRPGG